MLIISCERALKSLGWVLLLLGTLIYVLALFLTQEVTELKIQRVELFGDLESDRATEEEKKLAKLMLDWFGSVDSSMLSLYAAVAEGIHWEELMEPCAEFIS